MRRRSTPAAADPWIEYLARFHTAHPGITESVLSHSWHPEVGDPYRWLRDAFPARPARVLDLACGNAPMRPLFEGCDYLGIDVSRAELRVAQAQRRGPVLIGDALSIPAESGSFDAVVCSMAIMLLRPVEAAVSEIARVLRPGGTFAAIRPVSTPLALKDLRVVAPLLMTLRHLPELPQHLTGRSLSRVLTRAGLEVVDTGGLRFAHPLTTEADARLAVEALYLPHVPDDRREAGAARLAQLAKSGREVPVSIHRAIARRPN